MFVLETGKPLVNFHLKLVKKLLYKNWLSCSFLYHVILNKAISQNLSHRHHGWTFKLTCSLVSVERQEILCNPLLCNVSSVIRSSVLVCSFRQKSEQKVQAFWINTNFTFPLVSRFFGNHAIVPMSHHQRNDTCLTNKQNWKHVTIINFQVYVQEIRGHWQTVKPTLI